MTQPQVAALITPEDLSASPTEADIHAVNAALAAIKAYCGWHVSPVITETITVEVGETNLVVLPTMNVMSVESIAVNDQPVTFARSDWSALGLIWIKPTRRRSVIEVRLTHGIEPDDALRAAALTLARAARAEGGGRIEVMRRVGAAQVQYARADELVGAAVAQDPLSVLTHYKINPRP